MGDKPQPAHSGIDGLMQSGLERWMLIHDVRGASKYCIVRDDGPSIDATDRAVEAGFRVSELEIEHLFGADPEFPPFGVDERSAHAEARTRISAAGKVVAPGLIDAHVHGDLILLADPYHEPAVRQGVTTDIIGQDGVAMAPATPGTTSVILY